MILLNLVNVKFSEFSFSIISCFSFKILRILQPLYITYDCPGVYLIYFIIEGTNKTKRPHQKESSIEEAVEKKKKTELENIECPGNTIGKEFSL